MKSGKGGSIMSKLRSAAHNVAQSVESSTGDNDGKDKKKPGLLSLSKAKIFNLMDQALSLNEKGRTLMRATNEVEFLSWLTKRGFDVNRWRMNRPVQKLLLNESMAGRMALVSAGKGGLGLGVRRVMHVLYVRVLDDSGQILMHENYASSLNSNLKQSSKKRQQGKATRKHGTGTGKLKDVTIMCGMVVAETRRLKGLGCGLGMSFPIPPLGLHICSPPPAGEVSFHLRQPPKGCVQGPAPPPHARGVLTTCRRGQQVSDASVVFRMRAPRSCAQGPSAPLHTPPPTRMPQAHE